MEQLDLPFHRDFFSEPPYAYYLVDWVELEPEPCPICGAIDDPMCNRRCAEVIAEVYREDWDPTCFEDDGVPI